MKKDRLLLLLLLVFLLAYLLPLASRPLFIPDETRYAEVPREILASGGWVVPHLNGLDYFEKPILGYWAHALSQLVFGENRFAVRFPSALASGLSALLLLALGRYRSRVREDHTLAPLGGLIFLTCMAVFGIGTFAVLDNLLALFLTLTLVCFFRATESERGSSKERLWLAAAGLGCGGAFLTKGFLALAIPVLVAGPYLAWQRRWRDILRLPWIPLLATLMVALPWSLLVHQRAPDFWNYLFGQEHVKRFFSEHAQHARPAWFFLALLPVMALPWSFQAGSLWQGARKPARDDGEKRLVAYLGCWVVFPLLFFSASRGKLPTYILPLFPALAMLITIWLDRYLAGDGARRFNLGAWLAAGFFALLMLALPVVQLGGVLHLTPYATAGTWLGGVLALALTTSLFGAAARLVNKSAKLLLFACAPIPFFCFAPLLMPELTLAKKAPVSFLQTNVGRFANKTALSTGSLIPAMNWSLKRDDVLVLDNRGELSYGLDHAGDRQRFVSLADARDFIAGHRGRIVLFLKQKEYAHWEQRLPRPATITRNHDKGFVILEY